MSLVLFIVYLENASQNVRRQPEHDFLPEVAYVHDVDFIRMTEYRDVDGMQAKFQSHELNVNTDKTKYTGIERQSTRDNLLDSD